MSDNNYLGLGAFYPKAMQKPRKLSKINNELFLVSIQPNKKLIFFQKNVIFIYKNAELTYLQSLQGEGAKSLTN